MEGRFLWPITSSVSLLVFRGPFWGPEICFSKLLLMTGSYVKQKNVSIPEGMETFSSIASESAVIMADFS